MVIQGLKICPLVLDWWPNQPPTRATILSHFSAHATISEYVPLLEYTHTEVNCNVYNIGAPAFSIFSQKAFFFPQL